MVWSMAPPHQYARSDPFRIEDPTVSRYNQRLSKEDWDRLRPTITDLCDDAVPYADIMRRLKSDGVHVSRSQLMTQLGKWRLRLNAQGLPNQEETSTDRATPRQLTENVLPLTSSLEQIHPHLSEHPRLELDSSTATATAIPEFALLRVSEVSRPALEGEDQTESTFDSEAHISRNNVAIALAASPAAFDERTYSGGQRPSDDSDNSLLENLPGFEEETANPTDSIKSSPFWLMWCPGALRCPVSQPRLSLPPDTLSSKLQLVWESPTADPDHFMRRLPRLTHMASLLFALRCFENAFQTFFYLTSRINREIYAKQPRYLHLIVCVIGCARSASSKNQKKIAKILVAQLQNWLWRCYPSGQSADRRTATYLQGLLKMAEVLGEESPEETAYWTANTAVVCVQDEWSHLQEIQHLAGLWPSGIVQYYHESLEVQASLLRALEIITKCLHGEDQKIEALRFGAGHLEDKNRAAQALARLVLGKYVDSGRGGCRGRDKLRKDQRFHLELSWQFEEQALGTLCFVITEFTSQSLKAKFGTGLWPSEERCRFYCSGLIHQAMLRAQKALDDGPPHPAYSELIDLMLLHLGPCKPGSTESWPASSELLPAVAILSNVSTCPDVRYIDISPDFLPTMQARDSSSAEIPAIRSPPTNSEGDPGLFRDSLNNPQAMGSCRSSRSSAYRNFKALSTLIGNRFSRTNLSIRTASSGKMSERMSWQFSAVTGLPADPSARNSVASDAIMEDSERQITGTSNFL